MGDTPQSNCSLAHMAGEMEQLDNFVLCGHVSPDGDCIGSQLALYHALKALGKTATCVLVKDEPVPSELAFLPGAQEMVPAKLFDGEAGAFVAIDVPTRQRLGDDACAILDRCARSFTIDHHPSESPMTELYYVDPDAASASMLVWQLIKQFEGDVPRECAECAFTGLVTDTGSFRFQNADADSFALASEMVYHGAEPSFIAEHVFLNRTIASLKLEAIAIERMRVFAEGKAALSWVTREDLDALGATKDDVEPLVNVVRSVSGVQAICMMREQDGVVRGSLRAKGDMDVSVLARSLGGGGHKAASGVTLTMPIEQAVELMQEKLAQLIAEQAAR